MQDTIDNLEGEIWKDIPGYEGRYTVSNYGRIKSFDERYRFVKLIKTYDSGYQQIALSKGGIKSHRYIHRIVATVFIPNPENKPTVNHKNGGRSDNRVENLEWNTYSENIQHSFDKLGRDVSSYNNFCKNNLSKGRFGKSSYAAIPIIQFDMNMNFIKEWGSIIDAANSLGIFSTGICKVCKGKAKYAGGYKWRYKKDTDITQFIEDCQEDLLIIHS